jgi:hypothetical protein
MMIGACRRCGGSVRFDGAVEIDGIVYCVTCVDSSDLDDLARAQPKRFDRGARGKRRIRFRSYEEAREFVRSLSLKTHLEWIGYASHGARPDLPNRPEDIPASPYGVYKHDGTWVSWGDFLGTGHVAPSLRPYLGFEAARLFARSLRLKNAAEWRRFTTGGLPQLGAIPTKVPLQPEHKYAAEWKGWGDWLGTEVPPPRERNHRPFLEARAFARALALCDVQEWHKFATGGLPSKGLLPIDIPENPARYSAYRTEWRGWGDFLGTDRVAWRDRQYRSFKDAVTFARSLELRSHSQWMAYCHGELTSERGPLPDDIPMEPDKHCADEWRGYAWFLGTWTPPPAGIYRPLSESRAFARSRGISTPQQWRQFCSGALAHLGIRPQDVPRWPNVAYADVWNGWREFLGGDMAANT